MLLVGFGDRCCYFDAYSIRACFGYYFYPSVYKCLATSMALGYFGVHYNIDVRDCPYLVFNSRYYILIVTCTCRFSRLLTSLRRAAQNRYRPENESCRADNDHYWPDSSELSGQ